MLVTSGKVEVSWNHMLPVAVTRAISLTWLSYFRDSSHLMSNEIVARAATATVRNIQL